jgi:hypothetical protein
MQLDRESLPSMVEKVPALQDSQNSLPLRFEYVPDVHNVQTSAAGMLVNVPAPHALHEELQADPWAVEKNPAAQASHEVCPSCEE